MSALSATTFPPSTVICPAVAPSPPSTNVPLPLLTTGRMASTFSGTPNTSVAPSATFTIPSTRRPLVEFPICQTVGSPSASTVNPPKTDVWASNEISLTVALAGRTTVSASSGTTFPCQFAVSDQRSDDTPVHTLSSAIAIEAAESADATKTADAFFLMFISISPMLALSW